MRSWCVLTGFPDTPRTRRAAGGNFATFFCYGCGCPRHHHLSIRRRRQMYIIDRPRTVEATQHSRGVLEHWFYSVAAMIVLQWVPLCAAAEQGWAEHNAMHQIFVGDMIPGNQM